MLVQIGSSNAIFIPFPYIFIHITIPKTLILMDYDVFNTLKIYLYISQNGMLNGLLRTIGLEGLAQNWLGDTRWALMAVLVTIIWQFVGLYLIIFLAALQNIPEEILEVAKIDGASEWVTTWKITVPMIWDTIIVAVMLCISGSLKTFDLIYVMTKGGPAHSTEVMALYMFNETFNKLNYGYGSAVSVCIFIFSLILILMVTKLFGRKMM